MAEANKNNLDQYLKNIIWLKGKRTGFSQGWAINFLIKRYKIKADMVGHGNNLIAIATKKQIFIWEDAGSKLIFLGIKEIIKKSDNCKRFLKLMDSEENMTYCRAKSILLKEVPGIDMEELEKELDIYI